ncbi:MULTISPECIES: hypothetical protein [Phenylobacterium]|mgnify:CR=1 FL=1|uniref:Uncharacterized protein n=1 Tax=Phenylobacterium conjunctum TaxID=1298959 RepID=A0ABW3T2B7_9CAUL
MEPTVTKTRPLSALWRGPRRRRRMDASEDAVLMFGFALGLVVAAGLMLAAFSLGIAVGSAAR